MKTIVFQGDSITDAGRNRNDPAGLGTGYPNVVAAVLGAKYPGEYRFLNEGVSGDRVVDMYARIKRDCINDDPDVVTILIGINDVWHELGGNRNGVDNDKYFRVYCSFVEEVKHMRPGVKIVILEPFVLRGPATDSEWDVFRRETERRAASAKAVAEKYNLTFVPLQAKLDALVTEKTPSTYWLADGVHPTAAGHGFIAGQIISALGL